MPVFFSKHNTASSRLALVSLVSKHDTAPPTLALHQHRKGNFFLTISNFCLYDIYANFFISASTWYLRQTTTTDEAWKVKRNTCGGSRLLKHAAWMHPFILPVRLGTRFFNRRLIQHFLRHNTLRFVHSFLRRRHPPISTPVFTCHPARPTILRTTTSCSRHHLHRFHRSRLDLNTIRRLWCLSVRDATWMPPICNRRHFTCWKNWSQFLVSLSFLSIFLLFHVGEEILLIFLFSQLNPVRRTTTNWWLRNTPISTSRRPMGSTVSSFTIFIPAASNITFSIFFLFVLVEYKPEEETLTESFYPPTEGQEEASQCTGKFFLVHFLSERGIFIYYKFSSSAGPSHPWGQPRRRLAGDLSTIGTRPAGNGRVKNWAENWLKGRMNSLSRPPARRSHHVFRHQWYRKRKRKREESDQREMKDAGKKERLFFWRNR